MNNLQIASQILLEPQAAFNALGERPRFWFPLLLLVLGSAVGLFGYFQMVDFNWLNDNILRPASQSGSDAESSPLLSRGVVIGTSTAAVLIGLTVARLLESSYFLLAGRMANIERSFRHWMALSCWSALPLLLILLVSMGFMLMHPNGQVAQEELNVLSLNELLFHVQRNSPWHGWLSTLTILHPWVWWLSAIGVKAWSGRSMAFSVAFSMVPWSVYYGVWALIILVRA
ncbi:YIP1 family protein [Pelomonas sp. BJYL3]|uniref:YIP1 family protein n=1 Tax=Pelomonas sp. BJYL3 TaxID=2976697 RepID=UPI0022B43D4C|nr:YIP1 family protein [Pelomonas sp. BJYL3]